MAEAAAQVRRAWELCYLDPLAAREIGRALAAGTDSDAVATGWLHVALAEVRVGDLTVALDAVKRARAGYAAGPATGPVSGNAGPALCYEVQAIALRRAGDYAASERLQAALDARSDFHRSAMHRFIAQNSRAITAKVQGRVDAALRHFYAASEAALHTGWVGPRITALNNLGGYHQDLFNLEDARKLSEQALAAARESGARQITLTSAVNLIVIYHAAGEFQQARAMTEFLLTHEDELLPGALRDPGATLALAVGHLAVGETHAALRLLGSTPADAPGAGDSMVFRAWVTGRCLLAQGNPAAARDVAERALHQRLHKGLSDPPYDLMSLHQVLADACEAAGDAVAALPYLRQAHDIYVQLMVPSASARTIAMQASHQLAEAERERDLAVDTRRTVEDDRRRLVELNTALQAQVAETEMLHAKLREQALRDPLTGLHNRRYLFEMAPGLLELARRQGTTLCVVLMDLDHFKLLNDTFGHAAGDLVLQRFSALLTQMLRRSDVVVRHGGEEFVAVMPDIDGEGAQTMLGRLLEAFQAQQSEIGRRRLPRGSFSAGIALFPRHGSTLEQLLSRADRGLYAAKNRGRARIELAPRTGFGTLN